MAHCYILFSQKLDKFYIGSTELSVEDRLILHASKKYGNSKFTSKADDWSIYLDIPFPTIIQARKAEQFIKRMKNKSFIYNLKYDADFLDGMIKRL